jgi:hypothetical protein
LNSRALLTIGCDTYDYVKSLTGAEADATNIYDLLIQPEVGDYDASISRVLLSPTLQEVRDALKAILFSGVDLDTLTIAFAGHGAVSGGSFYMATRDSQLNALSATALSLADLFRMIAEAGPKQTYLIIDACQSGGLISDLNVILKSEVMGELGTPGITLLATAAANESALEIAGHGVGTTALLECVRGDIFLQDNNPALDLVEIGRAVSERVSDAGGQTPVVWGLNLYGPSSFCKNPQAGTGNAPLRSVLVGWPDAATAAAIRVGLPRIWEPYVAIPTRWEPRVFLDRLAPLMSDLQAEPDVLINLVQRVSEACAVRAEGAADHFREIEVRATCAVAMLPYSADPKISAHLVSMAVEIGALIESEIAEIVQGIDAYRYALLTGGMGDLYYLPIRLSKLLGWTGFAVLARLTTEAENEPAALVFAQLFAKIFETYSLSLVAMSDCQAPYIMTALTAATQIGLHDDGERLLGHLFASTIECEGRVARADLDPSKVLGYLLARHNNNAQPGIELVAQPTELFLALLRLSRLFDLPDEFDSSLHLVDHLTVNAYLPEDYRHFGTEHILGGTNAVFQVGHDFWAIADLEAAWPNFPMPGSDGAALTSILASLLFPDRSPWFLVPLPTLIEAEICLPIVA